MSALWNLSLVPFLDANGDPYAGAKAYFFDNGTTTPRTTYTDSAQTVPHDHPVVANASGRFPASFLQQGNYRLRITTADDVTIEDVDGITAPVVSQSVSGGGATDASLLMQTGMVIFSYREGSLTGFVRGNGRTIGNAGSGASERANSDCEDLFVHLWGQDATLTVAGGRGASAASDWAAGKAITLPDFRGRAPVGLDGMGNTVAGVISDSNIDASDTADTLGATGGTESQILTTSQLPAHGHTGTTDNSGNHDHGMNARVFNTSGSADQSRVSSGNAGGASYSAGITTQADGAHVHAFTTDDTGSGQGHPNIQPSLLITAYIKL